MVDDLRSVLVPTTSEILWGVIDGSLLSTVWNRITSSSGSLLSIGLKQLANITGQPMSTIINFVGGGATYICYVNGSQASFSTSIKYPVLAGGLAVRQNVNGTVKAMIQLMPMKIDQVGAASVMSNGTRYETADDMQVYLWYKGQYYATKLSEVNSEGYYLVLAAAGCWEMCGIARTAQSSCWKCCAGCWEMWDCPDIQSSWTRKRQHYISNLAGAAAPYRYNGCVRRGILNAKYQGKPWRAVEMGNRLVQLAFGGELTVQYGELLRSRCRGRPSGTT